MRNAPPERIVCPECGTEDVNYSVQPEAVVVTCSRFMHTIRSFPRDNSDGNEIKAWKEAVMKQRQRRELENNRLRRRIQ